MTVGFTRLGAPLFPWPEAAHALADETLGMPGAWSAAAPSGRPVVAAPHVLWNAELMRLFDAAALDYPARLTVQRNAMTEFTSSLGGAELTRDGE